MVVRDDEEERRLRQVADTLQKQVTELQKDNDAKDQEIRQLMMQILEAKENRNRIFDGEIDLRKVTAQEQPGGDLDEI